MIELDANNIEVHLRARGWCAPDTFLRAEPLTGGVSNVVFRVDTTAGQFILKQSRPQLRTRDTWFSDICRIYREQEVMEALSPFFQPDAVPRVLFVDRENYAFAMSQAPEGARVWKEQLLAGEIDPALGAHAGRFLGRMHQCTADNRDRFSSFDDVTIYDQLRIDPFYRRIQERRPEVAAAVKPILQDMLYRKEALCHGDYTPKNMLVHQTGFTLVDYETAHWGDPTMDLGLCLAHLVLKAVRRPNDAAALFDLIRAFLKAYASEATLRPADELERRGAAHLGVLLLARIDGTSPVDYLPEDEKRDRVRRLGRAILLDGLREWDAILAWLQAELKPDKTDA